MDWTCQDEQFCFHCPGSCLPLGTRHISKIILNNPRLKNGPYRIVKQKHTTSLCTYSWTPLILSLHLLLTSRLVLLVASSSSLYQYSFLSSIFYSTLPYSLFNLSSYIIFVILEYFFSFLVLVITRSSYCLCRFV
ncbi:hypothetical protein C8Q75DRAFT_4448 [Abortiporus biennis]|nr:hypothetical protein C8Q75DRAFT_4448 [Abortiporus biennis]